MIVNKEEKLDSAVSANGLAAQNAANSKNKHLLQRSQSAGELVFDRTVYTGIGFGLNEIGSLIFTGMFERGKGKYLGKQGFENASEWMVKKFNMTDHVKGGKVTTAHASAKNLLMWASLNFIGTVIILPIKILDNHKIGIVKKINHAWDKISGKKMTAEEVAARDADTAQAVACEHRQSWPTILIGRAAGMAAAIGGLGYMVGADRNEKVKEFSDKVLTKGASMVAKENSALSRQIANKESAFHYYARLTGVETIGCAVTSIVLEIVSKFTAKRRPIVKDAKLCAGTNVAGEGNGTSSEEEKSGKKFVSTVAQKPGMSHVQKITSEPQQSLQTGL